MKQSERDRLIREAMQWKAQPKKSAPEPPPPPVALRPLVVSATAAGLLLAVLVTFYLIWILSGTGSETRTTAHVPLHAATAPLAAALPGQARQHPHVIYVRPSPRVEAPPPRVAPTEEAPGAATYVPPPPGPNAGNVTI